MSVTFAEALAACRGRWGEPIEAATLGTVTFAVWDVGGADAMLHSGIDGLRLDVSTPREWEAWMLHDACPSEVSAPATPLAVALDGAARWCAGRNASTKGP